MRLTTYQSKEVNSIIAYHGSPKKFNKFDLSHIGEWSDIQGDDFNGLYFLKNEDFAKNWILDDSNWGSPGKSHLVKGKDVCYVYKCKLTYRHPFIVTNNDRQDEKKFNNLLSKNLRNEGYDIIINKDKWNLKGKLYDEYIVLDPSIIEILDVKQYGKTINESLLLEKNRNELINKSASGKPTKTYGTNRLTRASKVRIYAGTKHFNDLDMSGLFLANTLTLKLPIQGETNNYIVTVLFKGACDDIRQEIKANGYKVEFKAVYRALVKAVNRLNIYVGCTCPDMKFRFSYWATRNQYTADKPQLIPAKETNPHDDQGAACKHILNVLTKLDWVLELATTINNYILYMSENMFDKYKELMFKPIYGMSYDEAVRKGIVDTGEEEQGEIEPFDEPEEEPIEPENNGEPEDVEEPIEEPVDEPAEEPEGEDNQ